ncbi:MAG TPA: hypothetical protein VEK33_23565 [Terriglobales bacterium]|nr:hypothetical protein [Terriglobales bacterium]
MKNLLTIVAVYFLIPAALAQTVEVTAPPLTDTDIQLLRSDLQSAKNKIIADTMKFTEPESAAFWPVYRDYAHDQAAIADERLKVITDYAQHIDTMDDAKAKDLSQRMMAIEAKVTNLQQAYWPRFEKALGAKRAAKFLQVDNRLSLMINVQLASEIPLIP